MADRDPQTQGVYVEKVIELLQQLGGQMEALKAQQASRTKLPLAAFNLLSCAGSYGEKGCTVSQAAAQLGIRPQALNTPAARLAGEGLLVRQVDSSDSRARRLVITPQGRDRLKYAREILDDLAEIIARQVPAANVAHLFLSRLMKGAEAVLEPETGPPKP